MLNRGPMGVRSPMDEVSAGYYADRYTCFSTNARTSRPAGRRIVRGIIVALLVSSLVFLSASPAFAVTAWWEEPGMVVEADAAVTPADLSGRTPDAFEPDDSLKLAKPLRIDGELQDRVVVQGDEDWFVLRAADGPGYIRIGATGPIQVSAAPGDDFGGGVFEAEYDGPQQGADLLETSLRSITERAINLDVDRAHMRITTSSRTPIAYRISFVSELPENRVGGAYGPGIAAQNYITAVAEGNLTTLYRTTRTRYTEQEATALREQLFGARDVFENGFWFHMQDPSADVNVLGELPVQRIILSDEDSPDEGRHWAFVITCEQRDGLWLVNDARRDPDLTEEEVEAIVRRDLESEFQYGDSAETGAASLNGRLALGLGLAGVLGIVALVATGLYLRSRKE